MGVERQQGGACQPDLFDEAQRKALRLGAGGEGGTGSAAYEERQAPTASEQERALTQHLMERIASSATVEALGVPGHRARTLARTGMGWWAMSATAPAHEAMTLAWFRRQGLVSLTDGYTALQPTGNRRGTRSVCPVVWEGRTARCPPIPI